VQVVTVTYAHATVAPGELWGSWSFEPLVLASLVAVVAMYAIGGRRLPRLSHLWFALGVLALAAALVSPLDALGETLFSAHMVQHLVLIVVAAPLLALSRAGLAFALALPRAWRRQWRSLERGRLVRAVSHPGAVVVLHAAALWAWHLPSLYELAVGNEAAHIAEHLSFFATALGFWTLVARSGPRGRIGRFPAVGAVFVTLLQGAALGAILTFATSPIYTVHAPGALAWGLTPLEDQQLAGAIMWVPPGALYLACMAALLARALKESEPRLREAA
jgi:putative membrane protein